MGWRARLAWLDDNALLLEAFAAVNLAFLAVDIYVAHSVNAFRHPAEWIPFAFSILGAALLAANLLRATLSRATPFHAGAGRWVGFGVGWGAVVVGVAGLVWHLKSHVFQVATLKNLVYSAPFIAPLAYTGVGLLLITNRVVPHDSRAWARWVLVLAWGGFLGNFGLSLLDHAQNGFFYWEEWIAVAVSALAVGFVLVLLLGQPTRALLAAAAGVLAMQALTGLLGLAFHLRPLLAPAPAPLTERIVHGAPLFAPLLFVNLALLAAIGVRALWKDRGAAAAAPTQSHHPPNPQITR